MTSNEIGSMKYLTQNSYDNKLGLYVSDGIDYRKVITDDDLNAVYPVNSIKAGNGINIKYDKYAKTLTISKA
jgi:hypothetical protein